MEVSLTELLRSRGFKVTPQRLAIYDALCKTKIHPSAEMLFAELLPHYPGLSLATVYKTVDILRELGLVQVLNAGEDSFRYDAVVEEHAHIRCMKCNRVDDLIGLDTEDFMREASSRTDYQISGQQFYFFGMCPQCKGELLN